MVEMIIALIIKIPPIVGVPDLSSWNLSRVGASGLSVFSRIFKRERSLIIKGPKITHIRKALMAENTLRNVIYLKTLKPNQKSLRG